MNALLLSAALSLIPLQPDNGPPVLCANIAVVGVPLAVVGTGCVGDAIFADGFGK